MCCLRPQAAYAERQGAAWPQSQSAPAGIPLMKTTRTSTPTQRLLAQPGRAAAAMLMTRRGARAAPRRSRLRLHGRPPVHTSGAVQSCGVCQTGPAGGHSTVDASCLQQSGAAADLEELEAIDDSVLDLADLEEFVVSSPAHNHCAVAMSWEGQCAALAAVRTRSHHVVNCAERRGGRRGRGRQR